ncbi:MAG: 2-amino-4-hydroxy-6-hydroxymethyldihydropteridine diphosphokinase [Elusimicrobia bacterium CG06_land_8_20_14_3_00_38_11]|nr:MAG: 2-amino-4-hydroxy-6-hydroxymethyldihydropteridine diphosphokinase [Elusimicrobia bacterium CG06_land_8_20_14_3_00_38_11]
MTTVFLGLGSNRGNRKKNILRAIKLLKRSGQKVLRLSSLRETKPYGYKKQKKFLNAVVKLKTKLLPSELLELCKKIEKKIGRTKSFRWGPREIDIDILFFGKKIIKNKKLTIPHKDLHNRAFVLQPLMEIAPNFVHPVLKKRVSEL